MKLHLLASTILISATLYGCASAPKATASKTLDQNGATVFDVSCSGATVPMSACYDKALEVCPQGFSVVDRKTRSGSVRTFSSDGGVTTGMSATGVNKGIFIKCVEAP